MIGNDWDIVLKGTFESEIFKNIMFKVNQEYNKNVCYPKYDDIFNSLKLTPYKNVKVIILGQDPYHGEGEAHGLAFSVQKNVKIPPSLRNIFKELNDDLNIKTPKYGDLTNWAKEGVLLLNSVLTVRKDEASSHRYIGWELFTDEIIKKINMKQEPVVFILWGSFAKMKKKYITNNIHYILESNHPSSLSAYRGFFGSRPFSKANNFLEKNNIKKIDFNL